MLQALLNSEAMQGVLGLGAVGVPALQLWVMYQLTSLRKELHSQFEDMRKNTTRAIGNVEERVHRLEVSRAVDVGKHEHMQYIIDNLCAFCGTPGIKHRRNVEDTEVIPASKKQDESDS